ncbi:MAG: hypothetical protein AAFV53_23625 [Myxococcota bacterium]
MGVLEQLSGLDRVLRGTPLPHLDDLLIWEDQLTTLQGRLPAAPSIERLDEDGARRALQVIIARVEHETTFGRAMLSPLRLDAMLDPGALIRPDGPIRINPELPRQLYARSLPYRGQIELSPPSSRFLDPRYHLEALCQGRLPLELRAVQHELIHLLQVDARRELTLLIVMGLIPLFWPVLIWLLFARLLPATAQHFLAAQEIQAHLNELEFDAQPEMAPVRAVVALGSYPFTSYLKPGELESLTAHIQSLRSLGMSESELVDLFKRINPVRGLAPLEAAVRRRCQDNGWGGAELQRLIRGRELRLQAERLQVRAITLQVLGSLPDAAVLAK